MARTPEQMQADEQLTAAVQAAAVVYGWAPDAIVTDYIVALSAQTWDTDGDTTADEGVLVRDGYLPNYRAAGLARYAVEAFHDNELLDAYAFPDDDGEDG
jgi:hypothetical protein